MEQVAEESRSAIEMGEVEGGVKHEGRTVDDTLALKLLLNVQKFSLWFNDFSQGDVRRLHAGDSHGRRLHVTRFSKGDRIMRCGEAATFMAILLQGELGIRIGSGKGFPRRLHKGALFGERAMFSAGSTRAADVVALTDGFIGTMLYSEIELLGEAYPELMRIFHLQLARGALEEKLADSGMSIDDLDATSLARQLDELLRRQSDARWKARHAELVAQREGLYADLHAEAEVEAEKAARARQDAEGRAGMVQARRGSTQTLLKKMLRSKG